MSGIFGASIIPAMAGQSPLEEDLVALFGGDALAAASYIATAQGAGWTGAQLSALLAYALTQGGPSAVQSRFITTPLDFFGVPVAPSFDWLPIVALAQVTTITIATDYP